MKFLWQNIKRPWLRFILFTTLVWGVVFISPSVHPNPETLIYFYNPDANLRDVAQLKSEVQKYFRQIDSGVQLKAFLRLSDLRRAMQTQPPDFLVAASWVSKSYSSQYGLKPLLTGKVGANKSYHKVLISKKNLPNSGSPSLSMVGFGNKNISTLKSLVPILRNLTNLNVVEVNKDIDAVLAVSFDQVDLGLVRSQNIEAIRKVNQSAVANIKVLGKSAPIQYPIFSASNKASAPMVQKFVQGLTGSSAQGGGAALDLMGFSSWGGI